MFIAHQIKSKLKMKQENKECNLTSSIKSKNILLIKYCDNQMLNEIIPFHWNVKSKICFTNWKQTMLEVQ